MPLVGGLDTETTGLKFGEHRFVELCLTIYDADTRKKVDHVHTLIDPQRSIPAEAQRIHRITPADVAGAPTFEAYGPSFKGAIDRCDELVIHNAGFDVPFLNYEFDRIGLGPIQVPATDTFLEGRWATPDGRAPSLKDLCFACGVHYDTTKNHRADYDVEVMMESFFNAVSWGWLSMKTIVQRAAA